MYFSHSSKNLIKIYCIGETIFVTLKYLVGHRFNENNLVKAAVLSYVFFDNL